MNTRITDLERQIAALESELRALKEAERARLSAEYVAENGIHVSMVNLSDTAEGSYWGHISAFVDYIRSLPRKKPYTEWNTLIYKTDELLAGGFKQTPARLVDVIGYRDE